VYIYICIYPCVTGADCRVVFVCPEAENSTVEAVPTGTVLYPRPVPPLPLPRGGAEGVEEATGWHAYYDKDRDIYYHNSVTGVTQVLDFFFKKNLTLTLFTFTHLRFTHFTSE